MQWPYSVRNWNWVNIDSGQGVLPDDNKPLPEPVLNYNFGHSSETNSLVDYPHRGPAMWNFDNVLLLIWTGVWTNNSMVVELSPYDTSL